ncbi:MAG: tRNA (5-methylaminomethyl-2-thiouridine)(34)-methyltransferase MnmD [Bernardetiaceae bacterium]|nr:tRNA (5-methylaminomethyl-2-thiouridine)(34)-methyltransferase MnmD [Bernardetiaceae bacterium]
MHTTTYQQDLSIIESRDGSHTIRHAQLEETYHSMHGALKESEYVYIQQGFDALIASEVRILEIGFGTGLNVALTYEAALKQRKKVFFDSIEAYPIASDMVAMLNYKSLLRAQASAIFDELHSCLWEQDVAFHQLFSLKKRHSELAQAMLPEAYYDLVYYDAFAPSKQPEMWDISLLEKVVQSMKEGGILVTYCAQGQFKRNLKALGLDVETLDGPPPKKEMVRARKLGIKSDE